MTKWQQKTAPQSKQFILQYSKLPAFAKSTQNLPALYAGDKKLLEELGRALSVYSQDRIGLFLDSDLADSR